MGLPGYQLPPGFRFHPTDQELIDAYLKKKIASSLSPAASIIADIDLYKYNPWDLPGKAFFGEDEWFFFSPRDRKYPNGARPNRAAGTGYWKATGTDKPILAACSAHCLGVKKALVFYKGRPQKGTKTDWVMHEYRILDANLSSSPKNKGSMRLDDWVLCRVRRKNSLPLQADYQRFSTNPNRNNISTEQVHKKGITRERSGLVQGSDYQMLAYLLGSQDEVNNGYENSTIGSNQTYSQKTANYKAEEAQPLHQVLDSIKRKLSFGALDEYFLSQPSNRFNNNDSSLEQLLSPTESGRLMDENFADSYFDLGSTITIAGGFKCYEN